MTRAIIVLSGWALLAAPQIGGAPRKPPLPSPLDEFIASSMARQNSIESGTPGSLWSDDSRLSMLTNDLRASRIDDIVTIVVNERASAVATGNTKTARSSSANAKIDALAGIPRTSGILPNLLSASSQSQLDGQGTTSRETTLQTTLAARVTHVLSNGLLVVEGTKTILVNSENQVIRVRGVVRPIDLSTSNGVATDRIAQLEVSVNGKGVVNDAVRRPLLLYRLLLGLLPF
jgi:flagellar L-ring protein FlgH